MTLYSTLHSTVRPATKNCSVIIAYLLFEAHAHRKQHDFEAEAPPHNYKSQRALPIISDPP